MFDIVTEKLLGASRGPERLLRAIKSCYEVRWQLFGGSSLEVRSVLTTALDYTEGCTIMYMYMFQDNCLHVHALFSLRTAHNGKYQ